MKTWTLDSSHDYYDTATDRVIALRKEGYETRVHTRHKPHEEFYFMSFESFDVEKHKPEPKGETNA
mgnify:CR=1 FL=1